MRLSPDSAPSICSHRPSTPWPASPSSAPADPVAAVGRIRLDQLLVQRGLAPSRTQAQALILAGRVFRGEERLDKAGQTLQSDVELTVREGRRHVGRGALKLLGALEAFQLDPDGREALDVGASTGGFTQVLLEAGARRVIALDVGRGQLDWTLRQDDRVVVLEGCNARYLQPDQLEGAPDLAVMDVSFISVEKVLPAVIRCLRCSADLVVLIKPQFEVGRGRVGRGGIVRDPGLHREVLRRMLDRADSDGWGAQGVTASPVLGADGNREFFLWLQPGRSAAAELEEQVERLTESSTEAT